MSWYASYADCDLVFKEMPDPTGARRIKEILVKESRTEDGYGEVEITEDSTVIHLRNIHGFRTDLEHPLQKYARPFKNTKAYRAECDGVMYFWCIKNGTVLWSDPIITPDGNWREIE